VRSDYAQVATIVAQNADAVATRFGYSLDELATIPAGNKNKEARKFRIGIIL
jgi:hypothetical protein